VWGFLGVGRGNIHNSRSASRLTTASSTASASEEPIREHGGLALRMASLGMRHEFDSPGPARLSLLGDFGTATLAVGFGEGALAGLGASTSRARLGIEGSIVAGNFSGTLRLSGRADGGDGIIGSGLELATGLRYTAGRFEGGISGRWLAVHSAAGYSERSLAASLDWRARQDGSGLTLSLAPSWGRPGGLGIGAIASMGAMGDMNGTMGGIAATGNSGSTLWDEEHLRSLSATPGGTIAANVLTFETRIGYGLLGAAGQRLQPSAVWRDSGAFREAGLGLEYEGAWTLQMEMTHRASALDPAHWGIQLGIVGPFGGGKTTD